MSGSLAEVQATVLGAARAWLGDGRAQPAPAAGTERAAAAR
jgi:hypothetical protein